MRINFGNKEVVISGILNGSCSSWPFSFGVTDEVCW